jgi:hypothetical protein
VVFHPGVTGQRQGVVPQCVAQRFGEQAQIEATKVGCMNLPFLSGGITRVEQTACEDHAVKTTQLAGDLCGISANQ